MTTNDGFSLQIWNINKYYVESCLWLSFIFFNIRLIESKHIKKHMIYSADLIRYCPNIQILIVKIIKWFIILIFFGHQFDFHNVFFYSLISFCYSHINFQISSSIFHDVGVSTFLLLLLLIFPEEKKWWKNFKGSYDLQNG